MLYPNSYHTGRALVARLVIHTLATKREHPEDVIHTVLLHADGRCDYPKHYRGFKRLPGERKRVKIRTARGSYESPPRIITGGPDWTETDLLDGRKTGPRSPRGTLPERVRLTTFALWREHSKLPDVYREIVETVDREVADWLPGFGWLPTLSAVRTATHRATDAQTVLDTFQNDWNLAKPRYNTYYGGTAGSIAGAKFSQGWWQFMPEVAHACAMVEALVSAKSGTRFATLTDDAEVLDAHEKLHRRLRDWTAQVDAVLKAEAKPDRNEIVSPLEPE